jgi:hypothetical protein
LKKRTKKLLIAHPILECAGELPSGVEREQKFFGSFFQKRTASFALPYFEN